MVDAIVQRWVDRYVEAWTSNDPERIGALFTPDGTYAGSPFDPEPWIGREGIVRGWLDHRDEQGEWTFQGTPIAYSDGTGVVEGRTDYADGRVYANLWVIRFGEGASAHDAQAASFVEWFVEPGPARADQV